MPGTFIVLEGPDGSGTTTQAKKLAEFLRGKGHEVVETAEPTKGPIGSWIRQLLKDGSMTSDLALQLLFSADRAWHIGEVIAPALKAGKIVVCDRYVPSTIVYAKALGLEIKSIDQLISLNTNFIQPDLTLFTLPSLDVCLQRVGKRGSKEIFEKEAMQKAVYQKYVAYQKAHPEIVIVDTGGPKETSAAEIAKIVTLALAS